MMPNTQLISEMMRAATTPSQKLPSDRPQPHHWVIHAVIHSSSPLMTSEMRPSVRM